MTKQNDLTRHQKSLADFQKKLSTESQNEVKKVKEIARIERSITKSTSDSSFRSKQQQITRLMEAVSKIQAKQADLSKKIADTSDKLNKAKSALVKEQENERKKIQEAEKRREREQLSHQRAITQELRTQSSLINQSSNSQIKREVEYDVFISHASEDKESFVKPLVKALQTGGYKIWYDEFTLKVGDSLRRSIGNGLVKSRYGVVVLSTTFFEKKLDSIRT